MREVWWFSEIGEACCTQTYDGKWYVVARFKTVRLRNCHWLRRMLDVVRGVNFNSS